jgi:exodeoxyribonuclease VIII
MKNKIAMMVDLETLGKKAGAKVLTIGAITFDRDGLRTDGSFYNAIDREFWDKSFHEDPSTVKWWGEQSKAAQAEAFSGVEMPATVMADWVAYVARAKPDIIYCKGASFDFPIWIHACEFYGFDQEIALPYRALRCMRGLADLAGIEKVADVGTAHNAFDDARHQAMTVHAAITKLGAWERI